MLRKIENAAWIIGLVGLLLFGVSVVITAARPVGVPALAVAFVALCFAGLTWRIRRIKAAFDALRSR